MTTWLHEERLGAVLDAVHSARAARVLDLGCGDGDMFVRLATDARIKQLVGLDICPASLEKLRHRLTQCTVIAPVVELREASMTTPSPDLKGFDCAILVETIEHIPPDRLSQLENALFRTLRPETVVITTPNSEFNVLLGVPHHRFRHPDHQFEWDRAKFRHWTGRVAAAARYSVRVSDIGGFHPDFGGASQMAVFTKNFLGPAD